MVFRDFRPRDQNSLKSFDMDSIDNAGKESKKIFVKINAVKLTDT